MKPVKVIGMGWTFEEALSVVNNRPAPLDPDDMESVLWRWPAMLRYHPESGKLSWRLRESNPDAEGEVQWAARRVGRHRRASIVLIDGFRISSAELVWLLHHGAWPVGKIGRRDGDTLNDRIENLFDRGLEPKRPPGRPHGPNRKKPAAWVTGSAGALKAWGRGPHCKVFLGLFTDSAAALAACEAFERGADLV